jgi:hypothetical protein
VIASGHQLVDRAFQPHAVAIPANRSRVFAANARATPSCASPNPLTPNEDKTLSFGQVVEVF